jgi:dolichol-phosphate mannosyltransferase
MKKVSVIIPCYNEAEGISQLHDKLLPVLQRLRSKFEFELIFVDDGSTDDTGRLLQAAFQDCAFARVVKHECNMNLGAAIRTGVRESTGEWVANLDSDCTYDPSLLESMLERLGGGADLVTVSPYHPRGFVDGVPPYRMLLSRSLTAIYRILLRTKVHTFTAMARAYRRSRFPQIASPENDFTSVAEMMLKALKQKFSVEEVPAVLSVRKFGESKMKTAKVIRSHLHLIRRLIFNPSSFGPLPPKDFEALMSNPTTIHSCSKNLKAKKEELSLLSH